MEDQEGCVDRILSEIGFGKWQLSQYFWLCIFFLCWATQAFSIVMLGFTPDFACLPSFSKMAGNGSEALGLQFGQTCSWFNSSSNISMPCDGDIVYSEPKYVSIISEWDLTCSGAYLSDLSQTFMTGGMAVGVPIFAPLTDKFGRRKIIVGTHIGLLIVSVASSFVPNITLFIVSRTVLGALLAGCGAALWVTVLEIFIPRHRTVAALWGNVVWAICTCVLPGIGYAMKGLSWRHVQLALSALSFSIIGHIMWINEPIRWLLANGRRKEAMVIVQEACKQNKVGRSRMETILADHFQQTPSGYNLDDSKNELPEMNSALIINQMPDIKYIEYNPITDRVSLMDMLKNSHLRRINLIITIACSSFQRTTVFIFTSGYCTLALWLMMYIAYRFSNSLIYGGLYMLTSVMAGDRYLNLFLTTVVEIPSTLASIPLIMKFGRRNMCVVLHVIAGLALISAISIFFTTGRTSDVIEICIVVVGKFSISGSYNLLHIYTPELYPTNIRSSGFGVASAASRIGGLLYPFTTTLAREMRWLPSTVFGCLCFVVAVCCWFLPETANKDLPQTLKDLENLFQETKKSPEKDKLAMKDG